MFKICYLFFSFELLTNFHLFISCRYVANRLSEMGETAMSPSSSTDMTDVDMASIAEDELSEKFSVQGIATGKTSGKTKIVCFRYLINQGTRRL